MTPSEPVALACPQCGGKLRGVSSSAFVDCASCGSALAVWAPDHSVREAVEPALSRDEVVAAVRTFWKRKWVPMSFTSDANLEVPLLLFAPFHEIERTLCSPSGEANVFVDRVELAPAVIVPGIPLESLDAAASLEGAPRSALDVAALQRRAVVFDPTEAPTSASPGSGARVVEERSALVWLPVWVVRFHFGSNLYETAVDARTGTVLTGRAPIERAARLPEAIFWIYLFAFVVGMPLSWWWWLIGFFFQLHPIGGLILTIGCPGVVFWILAFAWDRLRFRREWAGDSRAVRQEAVNRPKRTLPERLRDAFFAAAKSLHDTLDKMSS